MTVDFEHAYILHRLTRNKEALDRCKSLQQSDIKTVLLTAQIYYKLAMYDKAVELYASLLKQMSQEDLPDLLTNIVACSAN